MPQIMIPKLIYAPQVVINFFIDKGEVGYHKYWSAGSVVAETGLEYKQVQQILNRFYDDRVLARKTCRNGVKMFALTKTRGKNGQR
jgi:hypothetical protein